MGRGLKRGRGSAFGLPDLSGEHTRKSQRGGRKMPKEDKAEIKIITGILPSLPQAPLRKPPRGKKVERSEKGSREPIDKAVRVDQECRGAIFSSHCWKKIERL